jgi:hypothetical protein
MSLRNLLGLILGLFWCAAALAAPIFSVSVSGLPPKTPGDLPLQQQVQVVFTVDPNGSPIDSFELFFVLPPSGISISDLAYGPRIVNGQPVTNGIFGAAFGSDTALSTPFELARFKATGGQIGSDLIWDDSGTNFVAQNGVRTAVFTGLVATVVPEPGTLSLMLAGIAGLTALGRRSAATTR